MATVTVQMAEKEGGDGRYGRFLLSREVDNAQDLLQLYIDAARGMGFHYIDTLEATSDLSRWVAE